MTRESTFAKGRRLLTEGRLNVRSVTAAEIVAVCRGDSAEVYAAGWAPGPGWTCTCPARTTECAHLVALRLVTVVTREHS
ncbi:hypothetical protein SAMN05660199_03953 [Klenkia soli]|uniref:SWIM-type domain-containing protein n=1 Tax=Klenkia soli TaxID=1052260 RepID=A0A1H0SXJ6_9ACTN|nr:hypothetical protein [Klenkia soli]SDP46270.1 hypothetical protein SAMN05660199_03953 [Klenkia soli]